MKQADCLRMALAELPQGTMEIVGRSAAEPGVLFTGTFQGETDGRGRMEVYPVFPGVEASFNTVLGPMPPSGTRRPGPRWRSTTAAWAGWAGTCGTACRSIWGRAICPSTVRTAARIL